MDTPAGRAYVNRTPSGLKALLPYPSARLVLRVIVSHLC